MSPPRADIFDRAQHPGKNLSAAGNFASRLDDVANTGNARLLPRQRHRQRNILNPRILAHQREQLAFIDLEHLVLVRETMAQANLLYRKFRDFKFHIHYGDDRMRQSE